MSLQLGKELFDVSVNVDTSARAPRAGAPGAPPAPGPNSQSNSQSLPPTPAPLKPSGGPASQLSDSPAPQPHQGLSYLVAQHHTSAILQVEAPITGFLSLRPTGMHSETHRKLVRAVGQKHSKVARLRLAPEGVVSRDPGAMSAEAAKAAKRKARASAGARRRADADDEESDGEYEKTRRRQRSSFSRGRSSKFVYSDDDADEPEAEATDDDDDNGEGGSPKKRRIDRLGVNKKGKARAGTGDYEADDFIVEDEPSDAEEGGTVSRAHPEASEPDLLDKIDRDIEDQTRRRRKEPLGDDDIESQDIDVESEGMDMSEPGDNPETVAKPGSRAPATSALNDDDAVPQANRKPKKRIIIEDDDDE
jgi:RNA polymerase-associated protein LEO1